MTSYPLQATFSRGELSPSLHARIDIEHYRLGLAECVNWTILRQGGLRRRSGTRFIASVKDHASATRLLPFVFSSEQAYMLEFGDGYFRVFANGGVVEAEPGVPVEVATAYGAEDVFDIQFTQSADVLYLVHRHHPPRKVERTGHAVWSLTDISFADGPWLADSDGTTALAPASTSGSIGLTASATAGINGGAGFSVTDVGRQIRFRASDGHWHWLVITAVADASHVSADYRGGIDLSTTPETLLTELPDTDPAGTWRLGAWSATTGYPARVAFHEERLTFARTDHQPQTLWMSRSGDFENMRPGAADDDAITMTILAGQVNEIQWIAEAKALQIGTTGATRTVSAPDPDKPLTPGNLKQSRHTTFGTEAIQPVQVGPVTLFVGAYGRCLREFIFSLEADGFVAPDISILSEHMLRTGVRQLAYAQDPDAIVWMVAGDGQLIGMTYERDQKVVGFHRHHIAGGVTDEFAAVESVATVPGNNGADETWLIVRRTVADATRRHIERLEPGFDGQPKAQAFHVDCGLSYEGPPANEVAGLDHLEGEAVAILADGAVDPPQVVVAGTIRLQGGRKASIVHAGLQFASVARTLPISASGRDGALLGRRKRVQKVFLDLLDTQGLKAGAAIERLERATWRLPADQMGSSPALFTGMAEVGIDDSWTNDGQILLVADQPLPATVLAVMPALEVEP